MENCESCYINPKRPGLFQVLHVTKMYGENLKYTRNLCARCIPDRQTFPGLVITKAVR